MWSHEFSKFYPYINCEQVWDVWKDINNWAEWHSDLDYCKLEGEFKVGNHFLLQPKDMPKPVKISLTAIEENHSFTDCTTFFGAKMFDTHIVESSANGVIIKNRVEVHGILSMIWVKLVAQKVANSAEDETDALVKLINQEI